MKLLAIDPGETTGLVFLNVEGDEITLLAFLDVSTRILKKNLPIILAKTDVAVIEDYRVFSSHAAHHIGARLITSELIGYIEAHCTLRSIELIKLEANEKGWWPEARMRAKHPEFQRVTGHARDALKIGLVYIEKQRRKYE